MNELTKRLQAVADLVPPQLSIADVGCDHGYVSIYLVESGIATKVIAMDVNEGPLEQARKHIARKGLSEKIETRLSNGVTALEKGEVQAVVIAGMGGRLMWRILMEQEEKIMQMKYLILQPQSEIPLFRSNLREKGFTIEAENMIFEDGKYYPMMRVKVPTEAEHGVPATDPLFDQYGEHLLKEKNACLQQYLLFEQKQYEEILSKMDPDSVRGKEIIEILQANERARCFF